MRLCFIFFDFFIFLLDFIIGLEAAVELLMGQHERRMKTKSSGSQSIAARECSMFSVAVRSILRRRHET